MTGGLLAAWVKWGDSWERRKDADARVAQAKDLAEAECQGELATAQAEAKAAELARLLIEQRLEAVIADRDAWRLAHSEEVDARRASEQATRNLMDVGQISLALLQALRDTVADRRHMEDRRKHNQRAGDTVADLPPEGGHDG